MSTPTPLGAARLAVGASLSPEVLAALDLIFPNTLPPLGTPLDQVARMQAHREVINTLRACHAEARNARLGSGT